ncbi:hypothetical protein JZO81_00750 [Enterococcus hulanensis]|uniref:hypothetical protein n=1 Tax=Enterococcus TaxID=1350 RepID=UPI000B5A7C7A|nr:MULTISPECIES: hypothetical protein [Enterococcus]MBO0409561.1 hypothetical protein [Enterococcus hulanensis]OTO15278.1 hypothetical protein A5875_004436 [Enterococcus sp. 3H8_DIV0648]
MKKKVGRLFVVLILLFQFLPITELTLAATTETEPSQSQQTVSSESVSETVQRSNTSSSAAAKQSSLLETSTSSQISTSPSDTIANSTSESQSTKETMPSVAKQTDQALPKAPTPAITIDFENERLEGFDVDAMYSLKYGSNVIPISGTTGYQLVEVMLGQNVEIIQKGVAGSTEDSDAQMLSLPKRPVMDSSFIRSSDETSEGANDGTLGAYGANMEYRLKGTEEWKVLPHYTTGTGPLAPGEYEIRFKAVQSKSQFKSLPFIRVIKAGIDREKIPTITINYEKEILEGFDPAGTYEVKFDAKTQYTVSGETTFKITDGSDSTFNMFSKVWKITKKNTNDQKPDSVQQELTIKARQQLPDGWVTAKDETAKDQNDGKLIGVDQAYEYRKTGEKSWIKGSTNSTVEGLAPGTYEIRMFASNTGLVFVSNTITKTINPGKAREETPEIKVNYEKEQLEGFDDQASYVIRFNQDVVSVSGTTTFKIPDDMFQNRWWKVIKKGDGQATQDSNPQDLLIKSRPYLPESGITVKHETEKNKNDGKLINVGSDRQYRMLGDQDWLIGTTNGTVENLSPGTYEIQIAPSNDSQTFASSVVTKTIEAGLITEETPGIAIDYENELLTNLDPAATYELKGVETFPPHTETGESVTISPGSDTYQITDNMMGKRWFIIRKARSNEYNDSVEQSLYLDLRWTINAANFTAIKETQAGTKDGKLKNVFLNTQYRKKGDNNWLIGEQSGTVEGLEEAVYEIRYKADKDQRMFASKIVEVDLSNGLIQKIKPEIKIDYEREMLVNYLPNEQYKTASYVVDHWVNAPQPENLAVSITEEMFDTWTYVNIEAQAGVAVASEIQKFVIPARQTVDEKSVSVENESYAGAKDGRLTGILPNMEYRKTGASDWQKGTADGTITNLPAGTYEIRKASSNTEQKFASLPIKKEVKAGIPKAKTPELTVNYEGETLDGLDASAEYQITLDRKNYPVKGIKTYKIPPEMFGKDIRIVRVGDGKNSLTSDPQQLTVKARPVLDAKVVQVINESGKKKQDGQLKGVTADMEYRQVGEESWHQGTEKGVISNLAAGTYEIRYASSNDKQRFASESIAKVIKTDSEQAPVEPTPTPIPKPKSQSKSQPSAGKPTSKTPTGQLKKSVPAQKKTGKTYPRTLLKAGEKKVYGMMLAGILILTVVAIYWKKTKRDEV